MYSMLCSKFIFSFFIGLFYFVCCDELEIIPNISGIDQFIGNRLLVTCKGGKQMAWLNPKDYQIILVKGRVHVEQRDKNSLSLVFDEISADDQGNWTCASRNFNKTFRKQFTLNVYESIKFVNLSNVQTITEKRNEFISCLVIGRPKPIISWTFKGKKIEPSNMKYIQLRDGLLIKNVTNEDRGEYSCKAYQISATISNIEEQIILVKVRGSPIPTNTSESVFYGYVGGVTNLTCEFESEFPTKVSWFRKDNRSVCNQSIFFNSFNMFSVQISITNNSAFGEYFCNATNQFGSTVAKVFLMPGKKPQLPQRILLRNVGTNYLKFYVKNAKLLENFMQIYGYRFEVIPKKNFTGNWRTAKVFEFVMRSGNLYKLTNLKEDTIYFIRIASRNYAGISDWSRTLEYSTGLQPQMLAWTNSSKQQQITFLLLAFNLFPFLLIWC